MVQTIQKIGRSTIALIREIGSIGCFVSTAVFYIFTPPFLWNRLIRQLYFIGVKTVLIVLLTGLFTGMVLSLQSYYVLVTFGAESNLGSILGLSLVKEIGPVITALMIIGRAGSALTAEIGIMRMSEQIDALDAMALNPYKYLVIPNLIAGVIAFPILTSFFILSGIWGGFLVSVKLTGLSSGLFFGPMADSIMPHDLLLGLYKSLSFGLVVTSICCYKGFFAGIGSGFGAQGVSKATTDAVVLSSVLILVVDYFITSIMLMKITYG
ncbi:MAG: ABC transporter permease [Candidatus Omnitrophica bacterium]|nr:ABC transporter permease [Candidatus Omnitrophota bacterium]